MSTRIRFTAACAVTCASFTLLAGCSSPFDASLYDGWQHADPAEWTASDNGAIHRRNTLRARLAPAGHADTPAPALPEAATVDDYVALALQRNPTLRAAEHRIQRLGARVPQATSLDDPMFQVAPFGQMAQTAAGQVGLMTSVSQKVPFPGKLDARGRMAQQDAAMAMADLQQARLQVAADVRRAYWTYSFTCRAIDTTRESRTLLDQFHQSAQSQYKAGQASQSDVLRASVELVNIDRELITLSQQRDTARSMLNQLTDRPIDAPLPTPPVAKPQFISAKLDDLLAEAAQRNPALRKVHQRIEQFRQMQKLAKLSRRPDLTVSANYTAVDDRGLAPMANGRDQWWFGFGINLPIWTDKYDAAEHEALEGMLEGVADLTAAHNRIAFEVQDAYLKVEAQRKLLDLFSRSILPQAQQAVEASAAGYRAGSVDFLTVADNWRKRLNYELMYHRAVTDFQQAAAELERAVGHDIASQEDAS